MGNMGHKLKAGQHFNYFMHHFYVWYGYLSRARKTYSVSPHVTVEHLKVCSKNYYKELKNKLKVK